MIATREGRLSHRNNRIRRYAAPTVQFVVVPFVALAWATAMSVVALVPIDVWTANYLTGSQREPTQHTVEVLWSISYWYD